MHVFLRRKKKRRRLLNVLNAYWCPKQILGYSSTHAHPWYPPNPHMCHINNAALSSPCESLCYITYLGCFLIQQQKQYCFTYFHFYSNINTDTNTGLSVHPERLGLGVPLLFAYKYKYVLNKYRYKHWSLFTSLVFLG